MKNANCPDCGSSSRIKCQMKVSFESGKEIEIEFNGTLEQVEQTKRYYLNEVIDWPAGEMPARVVSVERVL